jgi:UbiD family decarboxylase
VKDVHLLEAGGGASFLVVSTERAHPALPQRIMWAVWAYEPSFSKWVVVVDEDIDVRDYFQVLWAMSWHVQPAQDIYVNRDTAMVGLDPSVPEAAVDQQERKTPLSSKVGVDATRKHKFPALSVPPRVDMERIDAQWSEYGLE